MPGFSKKGKGACTCEACSNDVTRPPKVAPGPPNIPSHGCAAKCTPVLPVDIKHNVDDFCPPERHRGSCANAHASNFPQSQITTQIAHISDPNPQLVTQALQALQRLALNSSEHVSAHVGVAMTASTSPAQNMCPDTTCQTPPTVLPCGCQTPRLSDRTPDTPQLADNCPRMSFSEEKPLGRPNSAQQSPLSVVDIPSKRNSCSRNQSVQNRTQGNTAAPGRCSSPKPMPRNIALLTRPGCPFCEKAKNLLKDREMPFIEFPVRECDRKNVALAMTGETGVPQIWIDGKLIGGSDRLEKWLHKHDPR